MDKQHCARGKTVASTGAILPMILPWSRGEVCLQDSVYSRIVWLRHGGVSIAMAFRSVPIWKVIQRRAWTASIQELHLGGPAFSNHFQLDNLCTIFYVLHCSSTTWKSSVNGWTLLASVQSLWSAPASSSFARLCYSRASRNSFSWVLHSVSSI